MDELATKMVKKRDGSLEEFDQAKLERVIEWAIGDTKNVCVEDIVANARLNIKNGTKTSEIHKLIIKSAADLISENTPEYQWVASKLLSYKLRKEVWGGVNPPKFYDFLVKVVKRGLYDASILENYTEEEINKLDEYIKHEYDFLFTYAGISQMYDKYLLQHKKRKIIYETPQFAYMAVAMTIYQRYERTARIKTVKAAYDMYATFLSNLPTPQMAGLRTPSKSFSSCCLIDCGDSMRSLAASGAAVMLATAGKYGIGINMSKVRSLGSDIRNGEVEHTGIIPFIKVIEAQAKSCQQGGLRGGGGTVNLQWWHHEIRDLMVLKNNAGVEETRARKLDYAVHIDKVLLDRIKRGENITLFSPHQVPELLEKFGTKDWEAAYIEYENNTSSKITKKVLPARELANLLIKERTETARIYIVNYDHVVQHSSWDEELAKPTMVNLCLEIAQPTKPIESLEDPDGEIGICTLGAINWLTTNTPAKMERVCNLTVRSLEEILDLQEYFCPAAANFALNRRSLGIGINNLAAALAAKGLRYDDPNALGYIHEMMEMQQYYLLKASNQLAKERGPCAKFNETKYAKGILPIDTYKKDIDTVIPEKYRTLKMDWEGLRADILKYGLRHSTLTAVMPVESSSVISNSTNGVEPVRAPITFKKSKVNFIAQVVPGYERYKDNYTWAYSLHDNRHYLNVAGVVSKFLDMCISTNLYYEYEHYPNGQIPAKLLLDEIAYAYKMGIPTLYYNNSDSKITVESESTDCAGGACKL